MDGDVRPVVPGPGRREVVLDQGEHLVVLGQHVHHERRRPAGLRPGGQGARQGGPHAVPLPPVGDHDADFRGRGPGEIVLIGGPPGPSYGPRDAPVQLSSGHELSMAGIAESVNWT